MAQLENVLSKKTDNQDNEMIESLLDNTRATMDHIKRLNEQISTLNKSVTSLESTLQEKDQEIASSNSCLAPLQNDVATLTTERDELATRSSLLEATLSEKEERIQKLEKAKITQGLIARIEQLKEEHSQYKAELETSRVREKELVEGNNLLRSKMKDCSDEAARFKSEAQTLRGELEVERERVIRLE